MPWRNWKAGSAAGLVFFFLSSIPITSCDADGAKIAELALARV